MNRMVSVGTLLMVLFAIGFMASSALAYNYRHLATWNEVKARMLDDRLKEANNSLSDTRSQLNEAQAQLKDLQAQLARSQAELSDTQSQLGQTRGQLSQEQQESQRRLSMIFAQEENLKVLKACLAGVATDDFYFKKGVDAFFAWADSKSDDDYNQAVNNFRSARQALDSVDADCKRAADLFQ